MSNNIEANNQGVSDQQPSLFRVRPDQDRIQPYRPDQRIYLSTIHARITPPGTEHQEAHKNLEVIETKAAQILKSSDKGAQFTSRPEYIGSVRRQKSLRGSCAIGVTFCIDGRMSMVIIAGPAMNVAEAKAGLIPTAASPLDGIPEIVSPRITEAVIDRPLKENSQLIQIDTLHGDLLKGDSSSSTAGIEVIDCAAIALMIQRGLLPKENPIGEFRKMLEESGNAIGRHYNNAARLLGGDALQNVALTAFYDTRTAGFIFGEGEGRLFTTDLTKKILRSDDFDLMHNIAQQDSYRHTFTRAETLATRENIMVDLESTLMSRSPMFAESLDKYIYEHLTPNGFTPEQQRAFRFFIARNVALQYLTGLYHGGEHALSSHNEQYISFSPDGLRVGQYDAEIQSFGATVSNHADTIDHLKTKVGLMDHIGKAKPPYISFLSKSQADKTSASEDRNTRAELRGTLQAIYQDKDILARIKAGELVIIPAILQEKTGIVKSIPNLAI